MEYKWLGKEYLAIKLNPGEELISSIKAIAEKENITSAMIQGLGAVNDITLETYRVAEQQYFENHMTGNFEITSISGTIDSYEGGYYSHFHITVADEDGHAWGGHLKKGIISVTAELILTVLPDEIERKHDDTVNLNFWSFKE